MTNQTWKDVVERVHRQLHDAYCQCEEHVQLLDALVHDPADMQWDHKALVEKFTGLIGHATAGMAMAMILDKLSDDKSDFTAAIGKAWMNLDKAKYGEAPTAEKAGDA